MADASDLHASKAARGASGGVDGRSLGQLFADLSRDVTTLVRDEVSLARVELSAKLARAGRHAGLLAAGALVAMTGWLILAASLVLLLVALGMPPWGSALLVGLGLSAIGGLFALRGLTSLRDEDLKPTETIRTLKETAAWKRPPH